MPTGRRRQELLGIAALLIGLFLGLTLLPWDLTGAVGRFAGGVLRQWLGVGAVLLAVLGLGTGLAALGRLTKVTPGRLAALLGGLILLVPYAIAIASGARTSSDFPADHADWSIAQQLVGLLPGAIATGVSAIVGTAGAIVAGLLGLSALTLFTLDWHPFRRLAVARAEPAAAGAAETADDAGPLIAPVRKRTGARERSDTGEAAPPADHAPQRTKKERKQQPALPAAAEPVRAQAAGSLTPPREGILDKPPVDEGPGTDQEFDKQRTVLEETLATFRVGGKVVDRTTGPVVTRYDVAPEPGVKVGRIVSLADDLALAMRAQSIRIVAPVPGKAAVGIEVPNPKRRVVSLRALLDSETWRDSHMALPIALGEDIEGQPVIADLTRMPHLLIAGATGSGKSVCINTLITSLCYAHTPRTLRFLMIDPKMVELSVYQKLGYLLRHPVVTDNHQAAKVFKWAVEEMRRRYELLSANRARNLVDFNRKVADAKPLVDPAGRPTLASQAAADAGEQLTLEPAAYTGGVLPYVVLVVDELADLMMTVQGEVEKPLAILAQKARAVGIHIVLATQRPSVNVITGLIKANFPCRVAFRVSAKVDSRTILDQNGAEALLGLGDMLFLAPGKSESKRIQGAYISTEETERLVEWYEKHPWRPDTEEVDILEQVRAQEAAEAAEEGAVAGEMPEGDRDPRFREAAEVCIQNQLGSTSLLQRRMSIGYGRAARIIDQLHDAGILGPPDGSKPREVLVGMEQLDEYC